MNKDAIVLTRIDNRLVHGQVGVTWTVTLNVNTIVVVDDTVAVSRIPQRLMETVAQAANVKIRFYSIDEFAEIWDQAGRYQKLFLVVKEPWVARKLVEKGVPLKEVNVGNLHYDKGKRAYFKKVYLNDSEVDDLLYLVDQGVHVFHQEVPGSFSIEIKDLKKEL